MRAHYSPGLSSIQTTLRKPQYVDYRAEFKGHEWRVLKEALTEWQTRAPLGFDRSAARDMLKEIKGADR